VKRAGKPDSVPPESPPVWPPSIWAGGHPTGSVLPTRQLCEPHQCWPTWYCCA